ncbi:MAG: energy transducer TonB, partial [Blastocatellia bacterium]
IRPSYSEEARGNRVTGASRLRVLVGDDGSVAAIRVIRALPDLLTEQAIAATYGMKFKPATKDGKAVSHWVIIDVEFDLR